MPALFRCLYCGEVMGFERTAEHDKTCPGPNHKPYKSTTPNQPKEDK